MWHLCSRLVRNQLLHGDRISKVSITQFQVSALGLRLLSLGHRLNHISWHLTLNWRCVVRTEYRYFKHLLHLSLGRQLHAQQSTSCFPQNHSFSSVLMALEVGKAPSWGSCSFSASPLLSHQLLGTALQRRQPLPQEAWQTADVLPAPYQKKVHFSFSSPPYHRTPISTKKRNKLYRIKQFSLPKGV